MIKVTGINHIAIAAPSQLAEMRRFYVDVLGIASVPRDSDTSYGPTLLTEAAGETKRAPAVLKNHT